eukprot:3943958-Amphidinium_carterae.1
MAAQLPCALLVVSTLDAATTLAEASERSLPLPRHVRRSAAIAGSQRTTADINAKRGGSKFGQFSL